MGKVNGQRQEAAGLKTTCHLGETSIANVHQEYFPVLDRIGHGIHIPLHKPELLKDLAKRQITLEVCPTSYRQTGVLKDLSELAPGFCPVSKKQEWLLLYARITLDETPLHVRLPGEYERLIDHDVIEFSDLKQIQNEGFRSAFGFVGSSKF